MELDTPEDGNVRSARFSASGVGWRLCPTDWEELMLTQRRKGKTRLDTSDHGSDESIVGWWLCPINWEELMLTQRRKGAKERPGGIGVEAAL